MPIPDAQKFFAHLIRRLDSNRRQTWDKSSVKLFITEAFNELLVAEMQQDPLVINASTITPDLLAGAAKPGKIIRTPEFGGYTLNPFDQKEAQVELAPRPAGDREGKA